MPDRPIPLILPRPARLSEHVEALREVEASGVFSNGGPVVSRFEREVCDQLFQGEGACHAVANATLGLILAIREAAGRDWRGERYAMMPAFTFAATAHAAIWAGLTPLLVDSDPADWAASAEAEEAALNRYGERIAVAVPYATLGTCIDLDRYAEMMAKRGIGVVVDAAASLGAIDERGRGFGAGYPFASVYSMHATKPFATAEGGLVHSGDTRRIDAIRTMGNFGFGRPRSATMTGTNAKLPEILGILAAAKLAQIDREADHRAALLSAYRDHLGGFDLQRLSGRRPIAQFQSLMLPRDLAPRRADIIGLLAQKGIGAAHYFSPHLGEQPYFVATSVREPLPVADDIASRALSLPLHEGVSVSDVPAIAEALISACEESSTPSRVMAQARDADRTGTLIVGGGPGGMAVLVSAARHGKLEALAAQGLVIADRGDSFGSGQLGDYAITSDSTAETFLTAIAENPYPEIASLADAPAGRTIAGYRGALGVPLAQTPPFLRELGERLGRIVERNGASLLRGTEIVSARRRRGGGWEAQMRTGDGAQRSIVADNILIATGGHQCEATSRAEILGGETLGSLAGDRLVMSEQIIRTGGVAALRERLAETPAPCIAVVGGSTSALSTVALLLKASPALALGANAVSLVHRRPLRPFYPSAEAALADGYADFDDADICPVSGFVYRLAGFRLEARELLLRMLAVGGRVPDPRVAFVAASDGGESARRAVADADIVVAALGYRPNALPLYDAAGGRIALNAEAPGRPRLVNQRCEVIDADGAAVAGAYGIGLAAGFIPEGRLGGEPSFSGKANGLWLWQNDVGEMIVERLLETRRRVAA